MAGSAKKSPYENLYPERYVQILGEAQLGALSQLVAGMPHLKAVMTRWATTPGVFDLDAAGRPPPPFISPQVAAKLGRELETAAAADESENALSARGGRELLGRALPSLFDRKSSEKSAEPPHRVVARAAHHYFVQVYGHIIATMSSATVKGLPPEGAKATLAKLFSDGPGRGAEIPRSWAQGIWDGQLSTLLTTQLHDAREFGLQAADAGQITHVESAGALPIFLEDKDAPHPRGDLLWRPVAVAVPAGETLHYYARRGDPVKLVTREWTPGKATKRRAAQSLADAQGAPPYAHALRAIAVALGQRRFYSDVLASVRTGAGEGRAPSHEAQVLQLKDAVEEVVHPDGLAAVRDIFTRKSGPPVGATHEALWHYGAALVRMVSVQQLPEVSWSEEERKRESYMQLFVGGASPEQPKPAAAHKQLGFYGGRLYNALSLLDFLSVWPRNVVGPEPPVGEAATDTMDATVQAQYFLAPVEEQGGDPGAPRSFAEGMRNPTRASAGETKGDNVGVVAERLVAYSLPRHVVNSERVAAKGIVVSGLHDMALRIVLSVDTLRRLTPSEAGWGQQPTPPVRLHVYAPHAANFVTPAADLPSSLVAQYRDSVGTQHAGGTDPVAVAWQAVRAHLRVALPTAMAVVLRSHIRWQWLPGFTHANVQANTGWQANIPPYPAGGRIKDPPEFKHLVGVYTSIESPDALRAQRVDEVFLLVAHCLARVQRAFLRRLATQKVADRVDRPLAAAVLETVVPGGLSSYQVELTMAAATLFAYRRVGGGGNHWGTSAGGTGVGAAAPDAAWLAWEDADVATVVNLLTLAIHKSGANHPAVANVLARIWQDNVRGAQEKLTHQNAVPRGVLLGVALAVRPPGAAPLPAWMGAALRSLPEAPDLDARAFRLSSPSEHWMAGMVDGSAWHLAAKRMWEGLLAARPRDPPAPSAKAHARLYFGVRADPRSS